MMTTRQRDRLTGRIFFRRPHRFGCRCLSACQTPASTCLDWRRESSTVRVTLPESLLHVKSSSMAVEKKRDKKRKEIDGQRQREKKTNYPPFSFSYISFYQCRTHQNVSCQLHLPRDTLVIPPNLPRK